MRRATFDKPGRLSFVRLAKLVELGSTSPVGGHEDRKYLP